MGNELAETRRREILEAAMAAFDRQGYAATTVDDIAAGAGISKGSIYNYFQSKQDLFTQLFNQAVSQDQADVDVLLDTPIPAGQRLRALLDYWHQGLANDLKIGRLTLEFWATAARESSGSPLAENLHVAYGRWLTQIRELIQSGVDSGEFDPSIDPQANAELFIGLIHGLMLHEILGFGSSVNPKLVATFKNLFLAGMSAKPAAPDMGSSDDE